MKRFIIMLIAGSFFLSTLTCGTNRELCTDEECKTLTNGERPYCLNGGLICAECRANTDCESKGQGFHCESGFCVSCTTDRYCGENCLNCGIEALTGHPTDKPFCNSPDSSTVKTCHGGSVYKHGTSTLATCAGCVEDNQCGNGGHCDPVAHICTNIGACPAQCPDGSLCHNGQCVECYTSSQCRSGICQDNHCSVGCHNNEDCASQEYCAFDYKLLIGQCMPGIQKGGSYAGGGLCDKEIGSCSIGFNSNNLRTLFGIMFLIIFATLLRRRALYAKRQR